MILVYEIVQYILIVLLFLLACYQLMLGVLAWSWRPHKLQDGRFKHSFLIVIPANDNRSDVSKTLYSLSGLLYPTNLYSLLVIVDNSANSTAMLAKTFGATMVEQQNRSALLQKSFWAGLLNYVKLGDDPFDAMIIVSPGSLISGTFLEVMNSYLHSGSDLIQSSILYLTGGTSLKKRLSQYTLLLNNHINKTGRKALGLKPSLQKNGVCLKADILNDERFDFNVLDNSWEFTLSLIKKGFRVNFAPEAYLSSPLLGDDGNRLYHDRPFGHRLKKIKTLVQSMRGSEQRKLWTQHLDELFRVATPPLSIFLGITFVMALLNFILYEIALIGFFILNCWLAILTILIIYLSLGWAADRYGIFQNNKMKRKPRTVGVNKTMASKS